MTAARCVGGFRAFGSAASSRDEETPEAILKRQYAGGEMRAGRWTSRNSRPG